ncbi:MAG: hypothetical protein U0T83_07405 [Bacteriovoracaceae bacterium]
MKESQTAFHIGNAVFEYGGKTPYQALKNISLTINQGSYLF